MNTWGLYSSLSPLTALSGSIAFTTNTNGTLPDDAVVYLLSESTGLVGEADSDPGVDDILVSIADTGTGSGAEAENFKLASTSGGLNSATPGADLNLGNTLTSGTGNAVEIHIRCLSAVAGVHTDCSLTISDIRERLA